MSKNRPMTKIYTTLTITQCQKACRCVKSYTISVVSLLNPICFILTHPTQGFEFNKFESSLSKAVKLTGFQVVVFFFRYFKKIFRYIFLDICNNLFPHCGPILLPRDNISKFIYPICGCYQSLSFHC